MLRRAFIIRQDYFGIEHVDLVEDLYLLALISSGEGEYELAELELPSSTVDTGKTSGG